MNGLIWIHDVVANSGIVDGILAGDSVLCAIVGVLLGCCIGQEHLKRTLDQDNG